MKPLLLLLLLCALVLGGCGYQVPGSAATWAGGEARTLHLDLFANRTREPLLENYLAEQLAYQLMRLRPVQLRQDAASAELSLVGTITDFNTGALAYDATDRISEYRVNMTCEAQLVRNRDGQVLWEMTLSRSDNFLAAVDKSVQMEAQELAARRIASRLAEDLATRLLDSF
ncbi:MAG: LPS assembly lipoprotein LptE [Desulfuromonadales bacterium]|nr:LPS assembly lipoprotein LptE [Desulfuromonadales bacterium]